MGPDTTRPQATNQREALLGQARAQVDMDQAEIDREVAKTQRKSIPPTRHPADLAFQQRASTLRHNVAAVATVLAQTEDEVARIHDLLAVQWPHKAATYRRSAEEARAGAKRAREAAQRFLD